MEQGKTPIDVFISYSHQDGRHLKQLQKHLAGLEQAGRVKLWCDGEIEVGKPWDDQIKQALRRAGVVVLLITADFLRSVYIAETELKLARERERQGLIDFVPILVDSCDYEAHWLSQLQTITVNDRSVVGSRLGSGAWEKVARQFRTKIEKIEGGRPVLQVLDDFDEVVHSGQAPLADLPAGTPRPDTFQSVSEFWRAKSLLPQIEMVTVRGTLSQFAPMMMGPPRAKRLLHREFRKAIETHRLFGKKRITINACLSISSGQMVHSEAPRNRPKRLLGLYESIARNCIPVFVTNEYYEAEVLPKFRESGGRACFEAAVTGRTFLLDNAFIRRILKRHRMDRILPSHLIDELSHEAYALEVGGPGTRVQRLTASPRYVDGDIWLAVRTDVKERFLTGFVDITDAGDREDEMHRLLDEARGSTVLTSYDKLASIEQLLDAEDVLGSKDG